MAGKIDATQAIDNYRKQFAKEAEWLMEHNGHDFEGARFILESALDLAMTDKLNEIYK